MSDKSPLTQSVPIYIVDAFAKAAFCGNPAAVCLLSPGQVLTDKQMQCIGTEMNLSETAFISLDKGDFVTAKSFGLRWFTPTTEVDLCGHATLASAAVLFKVLGNINDVITFTSRSGPLMVNKSDGTKISLNFPEDSPTPVDLADYRNLLQGVIGHLDNEKFNKLIVADQSLIQEVQLGKLGYLLVRLKDNVKREFFEALKPQIDKMVESDSTGLVTSVGVTLKGSRENGFVDSMGNVYDFVSRFFAPWYGIPEDPVTGSWYTVAGPYFAKELNKTSFYVRQCSKRGGDLWVTLDNQRVILTGESAVVLQGTFSLQKVNSE